MRDSNSSKALLLRWGLRNLFFRADLPCTALVNEAVEAEEDDEEEVETA